LLTVVQRRGYAPQGIALNSICRASAGDAFIVLIVAVVFTARLDPCTGGGHRTGHHTHPAALPWYALVSTARMAIAYLFSLSFTIVYAYTAARNRRARVIMLPLLDILQSVPILSFLPVVLLSMTTILPERLGVEVAAIVLIVTSQVWNMTFSFYQSLTTIPTELLEASAIFRLNPWLRFKTVEMPFGANGLIWNSMVSWAGGWFFLMAAESFNVGNRDFRLPGLGSYLQAAANAAHPAILLGLGTLVLGDHLPISWCGALPPGRSLQSGNVGWRHAAHLVVLRHSQSLVADATVYPARLPSQRRADRSAHGAFFRSARGYPLG
jgi:NitT/TauT family transport system permease protein